MKCLLNSKLKSQHGPAEEACAALLKKRVEEEDQVRLQLRLVGIYLRFPSRSAENVSGWLEFGAVCGFSAAVTRVEKDCERCEDDDDFGSR